MMLPLLSDVANHLWQSTLVLGVACGLAWLLRRNAARARFAIWLGASLKFLLPFAPLFSQPVFLRAQLLLGEYLDAADEPQRGRRSANYSFGVNPR